MEEVEAEIEVKAEIEVEAEVEIKSFWFDQSNLYQG